MPGGIDGANAYSELKALQSYARSNDVWQSAPKDMKLRTRHFLEGHGPDIQFKRDVALWYGAITDCDEAWKGQFLRRVFAVLYGGGLMVKRDAHWTPYASQRIPICSAISHTARVLIQLPDEDDGEFWRWLWGDEEPRRRLAASHGVQWLTQPESISNGLLTKSVEEVKGDKNVKHYGVNVALGGAGNHNLISGERIDESGLHGHLYIAYTRDEQRRVKALLIGAEQSAPFDRYGRKQGGISGLVENFFSRRIKKVLGVPDQYGGSHGIGGHSRYSATGGDDFAYTKGEAQERIPGAILYGYGPSVGNYYDGMFIHLTEERFERVLALGPLDPNLIGQPGGPPVPSKQGRVEVIDLRNRQVIGKKPKKNKESLIVHLHSNLT